MSKKARKPRRNDESPSESLRGEWEQFTSPDGHPYYYNKTTKESRWECPSMDESKAKPRRPSPQDSSGRNMKEDEPERRSPIVKKDRKKRKKKVEDHVVDTGTSKPSNVAFMKLQASLEGRLGAMHLGPPPMLNTRRETEYTEGAIREEVTTPSMSVEDQYEAETAGMSAAERLRFLRKKRQEEMMAKREDIAGDDFMAEVAKNMKKKGVVVAKRKEEGEGDEKVVSWREQEKMEEERKRRQMQEEMEAKKVEAEKKEREKEAAREREERREEEAAEMRRLEQEREQERKQRREQERKQRRKEAARMKQEKQQEDELNEHDVASHGRDGTEPNAQKCASVDESFVEQGQDHSETSLPERVKHRKHRRSQGTDHVVAEEREVIEQVEGAGNSHPSRDDRPSPEAVDTTDAMLDAKQRMYEERRARKKREKELLVASKLASVTSEPLRRRSTSSSNGTKEESRTRSSSSIEADEEAEAREKKMRRERRRRAKLKAAAAVAAQNLDENGSTQPVKSSEPHMDNSNGHTAAGLAYTAGYPMSGQPLSGQPPYSGGMYPPYPYMMTPPPSPYGYYYPYMQPPPMPMPMYPPVMMPPGHQMMPTPPHSANGMAVPSALIPYSTDSALIATSGYNMNFESMSYGPELSKCDCCKGVGVGLVEKNGVCAHCNRLRLAFIVDSAQMRLRCSVCGGWGFQLLQANGMCKHCNRNSAQKSQRRLAAVARRSSGASVIALVPRQTSAAKKDGYDDIDWDKSSSDDSEWDD